MKNLNPCSSKTAKSFALSLLLLLFCAAIAPRALAQTIYNIGGNTGTNAFWTAATAAAAGASHYADGDIIYLHGNIYYGGQTVADTSLIYWNSYKLAIGNGASNGISLSILSADNTWYVVTNTRALGTMTNVIQGYAGPNTYTINLIDFADNHTTGNGGAFLFQNTSGTNNPANNNMDYTSVLTLTGTMAFQRNTSGGLGGAIMIGGLASSVSITGSILFDSNKANLGGALEFGNGNNYSIGYTANIGGDILYTSNSANTGGAIDFNLLSPTTVTLSGHQQFLSNHSGTGGGGAIYALPAGNITDANIVTQPPGPYPSTLALAITGTTLFDRNDTQGNGGAINYGGQTLTIGGNTTFTNNTAAGLGGAIYQYNGISGTLAPSGAQAPGGVTITLDATTGDILFQNNIQNAGPALTAPGDHNAINLYSGGYAGTDGITHGGTTTLNLNTGAGRAIYLYDPITITDTTATGPAATTINLNLTGNGAVLLDTYQSTVNGTTTIQSGTFMLTNGAAYTNSDATNGAFTLAAPATLAANGAVQAATINLADGSSLAVLSGGTLALRAATLTGATNLHLSGNGTIDTAGKPLNATSINVGAPQATPAPQTLAIAPGTALTIADGGTLTFDIFSGNTSDLLAADTLLLSGSAYINLVGDISGNYKLITAANDLSVYASDFIALMNGATINFQNNGTELWVDLVLQNTFTRWTGADTAIWANSLSTHANWDNGAGVLTFINGDSVMFDDTAANKTVTIDPAGVAPGDMTVNNTPGNDYTIAGSGGITTAPGGRLTKTGSGALNFTNTAPNAFTDGIEISSGAIGFTNGNQLGAGGNGIHFTGASTLRSNADGLTLANTLIIDPGVTASLDTAGNTLIFGGTTSVSSSSTLAKTGAGTLRLTANNSANTGNTLINQGILSIDGPTAALGGTIDIAPGAILAGSGSATGNVNATPGTIIYPGATTSATAPVTLTINNLNLDSSTLSFNLFKTGTNDIINITGALTIAATGPTTINISTLQSGTFDLGNLTPIYAAGYQVTIAGAAQTSGGRQQATLAVNSNHLLLEATADISRILTWTGATGATWTPNDADWTDGAAVNLYAGGDRVIFNGTADAANPANRAIAIAGSGVTVSDMLVQGATNYTFTGAGITADPASVISGSVITTGAGKLVKAGSGTLALQNGANNFLGGIELNAGAITFTDAAQLGDGGNGITFTGAAKLAPAADYLTLAANITVLAGVTGTLDTGAYTLTLSGALADDPGGVLVKIGSGQLALAGNSTTPASDDLLIALNQGTLLLNNTAFTGTIAAAANTTVRNAPATTNTVNLALAASSTLTGAGTLAGAATLTGAPVAAIAAGDTLTLTGAITGAGGLLKTGAGELQFTAPAALGNTGATQIAEGTVRLAGITGTAAPLVSQNILLNGGTLAFNSGAGSAAADTSANDWSGITITQGANAAASAVTGASDNLYVGSGTQRYAILNGLNVIVRADPAAANTVLGNTANTFNGIVRVDSGTFQITDAAQLGAITGTAVKVSLNGGALEVSAPVATTRGIELRAAANTIAVDDGVSTQWGQITRNLLLTPAGATLTKIGSGTFANSGTIQAAALTVAAGRWVAVNNNNVPAGGGAVTVNAGATFQFNGTNAAGASAIGFVGSQTFTPSASGTINSPFTGDGTLEVTAGHLVFTSANTTISRVNVTGPDSAMAIQARTFAPDSTITIDQGKLVLAAGNLTAGNVVLKNGATMGFLMSGSAAAGTGLVTAGVPARTATLASLAATGTGVPNLWFNADLARGYADHLTVANTVTGTFGVNVNPVGGAPAQYHSTLKLIDAPAGGTFLINTPQLDIGLYSYNVGATTDSGGGISIDITGDGAMSKSASFINSTAAMLSLSWFAELNSVQQRLGELHMETRDGKAGLAAWVRGDAQRLNFNDKIAGSPFSETQYSGEAGLDYKIGDTASNIYLGAFLGYGRTQDNRDNAGDDSLDSVFGGIYATISAKTGWYLDAVGKFNNLQSRFTAFASTGASAAATYRNWAIGASLELGKYCDIGDGWFLEPQAQIAFTTIAGDTYEANNGMTVALSPGTSSRARAGILAGRVIETTRYGTLNAYLKAYYGEQWASDGGLTVATSDGQSNRYSPAIKGYAITGGAGLSWLFNRSTQLYLDYETTQANTYIKPWGFNLGLRHNW